MRRLYAILTALLGLALIIGMNIDLSAQGKKKKPPVNDDDPKHRPENAIANLEIHKDVQATLFVSEPKITNPTNLDIDHRGRIWLCDVKNYRGNNGRRPEGDRILILEDKDGDGVADSVKTFYQGRDIDSAMGICVLGNKLIVSASPNIFVFTFDEATDKVLKKEVLFTKTGQPQHDHSAHSFVFGPDGKYYWNFGNTGQAVRDKNGKQVVDLAGNPVIDNGKPYFGGMVFRCDPDGSNFETLGHNFRNNYEVIVDSFGTLWQSDNDDDGNRGVRINYVMEFGNYGYRDEMTGAGWQSKRTNLESEIPLRHWHLNDPGVVPNLLQTGGGSPTGICVYEGSLLPRVFHNQVIHCDAGPSVVRAYPVTPEGAGYKAEAVHILDGSKKNNWFRPADACVAPDGSLFVTDWYDPGVGGHQQRDIDRGRIFRVAPPGVKYQTPKFDFATAEGCIEALKNPALSVRYLAWTALNKMGDKAKEPLLNLFTGSKIAHEKARALWLLGKIPGNQEAAVKLGFENADPNLRIVALRLARQHKLDVIPLIRASLKDADAGVRRECLIALRHHTHKEAPALWAQLARRHDGKDRWYLEALGIAADKQWDSFLQAYIEPSPSAPWLGKPWRDIVWRSRATKTPELLAAMIASPVVPADELPRLFRAFDFQKSGEVKEAALVRLAFSTPTGNTKRDNLVTSEAIVRLGRFDLKAKPQYAAALNKLLDNTRGTTTFVDLVAKFNVTERYPDVLAMAQKSPTEQVGVDAMRALLDNDQNEVIRTGLSAKDPQVAIATVQAMASAAHGKSVPLVMPIVKDKKRDLELRRQATRALAKTKNGAAQLIKLAQTKELGEELKPAAGSALALAPWKEIKSQIADLFPIPAAKGNKPLPPISDLAKMKGNVANGKLVFAKAGTCANCHQVNGEGKHVGPDLSEIGKKLAREALLESILYPSASISHNFETWTVETKKGDLTNGVMVSQTPDEVTIKGADALVRTFKRTDVEALIRSPISLMPADLHKDLTAQDVADLVEYMTTLREAKKSK